jgi:hypothetical protein
MKSLRKHIRKMLSEEFLEEMKEGDTAYFPDIEGWYANMDRTAYPAGNRINIHSADGKRVGEMNGAFTKELDNGDLIPISSKLHYGGFNPTSDTTRWDNHTDWDFEDVKNAVRLVYLKKAEQDKIRLNENIGDKSE